MAKTQKFSEDRLLEAVVKYSEIEKKKIKATELAEWSRSHIAGLEGVRDYHFTRPIKERDNRSGKIITRPKLCTVRIEEINRSRSVTAMIRKNLLLKASNIDDFSELPVSVQRKMIAETRDTVDRLLVENQRLRRENETLRAENKKTGDLAAAAAEKAGFLARQQETLAKQVRYLMKAADETSRKKMLARMGVSDGEIDLNAYAQSLQIGINDVVNISRALQAHILADRDESADGGASLADTVLSGLDL